MFIIHTKFTGHIHHIHHLSAAHKNLHGGSVAFVAHNVVCFGVHIERPFKYSSVAKQTFAPEVYDVYGLPVVVCVLFKGGVIVPLIVFSVQRCVNFRPKGGVFQHWAKFQHVMQVYVVQCCLGVGIVVQLHSPSAQYVQIAQICSRLGFDERLHQFVGSHDLFRCSAEEPRTGFLLFFVHVFEPFGRLVQNAFRCPYRYLPHLCGNGG